MMLGKTNILFISKSDASEVQLIQERYLTPTTSEIIKIEYLNNMFLVYTSDKEVLRGTDINSLSFTKKDGKNLKATHFIFHEGKYYFCDASEGYKLKACVYATDNFTDYEEIIMEEEEGETWNLYLPGIFKDSSGRIIVAGYRYKKASSVTYDSQSRLHILSSFDERQDEEIIEGSKTGYDFVCTYSDGIPYTDAMLIKDRIFSGNRISDLAGNVRTTKNDFNSYANGYFYKGSYNRDNGFIVRIYKSFDGINWASCPSVDIMNAELWTRADSETNISHSVGNHEVLPLAGKTCLLYSLNRKVYVNLADRPDMIGNPSNETFELDISDFNKICAIAEDGTGNTYIGFRGGTIIKLYLDQDGTTKLPDVQLVKTLAAKQALVQAKQYTDEKVAELKAYVDSKIEQNAEATDVQG